MTEEIHQEMEGAMEEEATGLTHDEIRQCRQRHQRSRRRRLQGRGQGIARRVVQRGLPGIRHVGEQAATWLLSRGLIPIRRLL